MSRKATYTPTTVTNVAQYNEHLATGVLDVSWRCMGRRCNGGHAMENVQSENRAVERLIRIGEVKRRTGFSTATSEKGFEVAGCSRKATHTPTTVTNVVQYNERFATGVLNVSWRFMNDAARGTSHGKCSK